MYEEIKIVHAAFGLLGAIVGACGAYFAVREKLSVQIALVTERADAAKSSATHAHDRIDNHIEKFHSK